MQRIQAFVFFISLMITFSSCANLIKETRGGDIGAVKALLNEGADVDAEDSRKWTALMWAAKEGHEDVAKVLLNEGADVNVRGSSFSPISLASENGHFNIVKLLIEKGANVNNSNPLSAASENGHFNIAKLLIEKGAKVDKKAKNFLLLAGEDDPNKIRNHLNDVAGTDDIFITDDPALYYALARSYKNKAEYYGENNKIANESYKLSAKYFEKAAEYYAEVADDYMKYSKDVATQAASSRGSDLVSGAIISGDCLIGCLSVIYGEASGSRNIYSDLEEAHVEKSVKSTNLSIDCYLSAAPLYEKLGNEEKAQEMEAAGKGKPTLLRTFFISLKKRRTEIVKDILSKGFDVNYKRYDGTTALMVAAEENYVATLKVLLAKGAEINAKNRRNETALGLVIKKQKKAPYKDRKRFNSVIDLLKQHGAKE